MGTGWAVGAAATLGLSAALLARGQAGAGWLLPWLAAAVLAAWAYGVSMAAYGNKGALVAVAAHAAVAAALLGALGLARCAPGLACPAQDVALQALVALVGALAFLAGAGEALRRRGPIQWGTALFLLAPLALAVLVQVAVALAG